MTTEVSCKFTANKGSGIWPVDGLQKHPALLAVQKNIISLTIDCLNCYWKKKTPPVLFANLCLLVAGKCNLTKKGIISQSLRVKVVLCIINLGFIFHSNSIFYFFSPWLLHFNLFFCSLTPLLEESKECKVKF